MAKTKKNRPFTFVLSVDQQRKQIKEGKKSREKEEEGDVNREETRMKEKGHMPKKGSEGRDQAKITRRA